MQRAAQAYDAVAKQTANPRELEADLLLSAAARLQAIHDGWDAKLPELSAALVYNRRLWSIFLSAAEDNNNPNSLDIRQNIANIGVFVIKHTIEMQMDPDPKKLKTLIDINCNIAAGLSGRR